MSAFTELLLCVGHNGVKLSPPPIHFQTRSENALDSGKRQQAIGQSERVFVTGEIHDSGTVGLRAAQTPIPPSNLNANGFSSFSQ
jgi:hypothetical protein